MKNIYGITPLIHLPNLSKKYDCNIYLKFEENDLSSLYQKAVKTALETALVNKKIDSSTTIIEYASEKHALMIAKVCAQLSLKCVLVLKENINSTILHLLQLCNATTYFTKEDKLAIKTRKLLSKIPHSIKLSSFIKKKYFPYEEIIYETKKSFPDIDAFCFIKNSKYNFMRQQKMNIFLLQPNDTFKEYTQIVEDIDAYQTLHLVASKEGIILSVLSSYLLSGGLTFLKNNKIKNLIIICPDTYKSSSYCPFFYQNYSLKAKDIHNDIDILFTLFNQSTFIKSPLWIKYGIYQNDLLKIKNILLTDAKETLLNDPAATSLEEVILNYPGFFATFCYRLAHYLWNKSHYQIARCISEYAHSKTGIDIHPQAIIGHHFCIDHGTGIVIGQTSILGHHVRLYHNVTLGAISLNHPQELKNQKRHPTIKNHVIIYANASILGGDTIIGNHVIIGSDTFITSSIQDNRVVYTSKTNSIKKRTSL